MVDSEENAFAHVGHVLLFSQRNVKGLLLEPQPFFQLIKQRLIMLNMLNPEGFALFRPGSLLKKCSLNKLGLFLILLDLDIQNRPLLTGAFLLFIVKSGCIIIPFFENDILPSSRCQNHTNIL